MHEGRSVIIATGANAKYLGLPNEERLNGRGVSACATCDGFFFKGLEVVVIGGGDTAVEGRPYLFKLCKTVAGGPRRHEFWASKIIQGPLFQTPQVQIPLDTPDVGVLGDTQDEGA